MREHVALSLHILESGRNEYSDGDPRVVHGTEPRGLRDCASQYALAGYIVTPRIWAAMFLLSIESSPGCQTAQGGIVGAREMHDGNGPHEPSANIRADGRPGSYAKHALGILRAITGFGRIVGQQEVTQKRASRRSAFELHSGASRFSNGGR